MPPARDPGRGNSIGALAQGVRQVTRKPTRQPAPPISRSPVFGPLSQTRTPQRQLAQQTRRVARAQAPVTRRTSVPYVPKLQHPTSAQRGAAQEIVSGGLQRQGVTRSELPAIRRGVAGRQAQANLNRATGYARTLTRKTIPKSVARANRVPDLSLGVGAFGLPQVYTPQTVGQDIIARHIAVARPGVNRDTHVGLGPAQINLSPVARTLGAKLAGNPLSAFTKGIVGIASARPFSDKGVLSRSLNDLLTYPAAAIPTAYQAVTSPGSLAKGIEQQVTHPVETFKEHPLFGALLAHGAVSAVGRTAGALGRAGGLEAASTSRSALGLAGESGARINLPRVGSKDVIRRSAQRAYDKSLSPVRDRNGNVVKDARGRPVLAAPTNRLLHPFNNPERLQAKRGDFFASRANTVERNDRAVATKGVVEAAPVRQVPGGRVGRVVGRQVARAQPERDLVAMAMEGTLRPGHLVEDLQKERVRLEDAYRSNELKPIQKRTNRLRARTIDRALNDPRMLQNEQAIFGSARTLARQSNNLSAQSVEAGMLHPDAAARAKLFPYAQSHMGAQPIEHSDGRVTLRAGDGTFLSNEQIHAHMQENGVHPGDIAYLPHRFDVRGARAYHQQFQLRRPNLDQESRTGTAYAKGATAHDFSLPLEHIVRQATTLARVHEFDRLIHEVGIKHPTGRYFTWQEAKDYGARGGRAPNEATNELLPGEPNLVPVRALPAKYEAGRAQDIQNQQTPAAPGGSERLIQEQTARFQSPHPADAGAENTVLVPEGIAKRLQENLKGTGGLDKRFQALTSAFRTTVLPFSTKWLTGNVAESLMRLGVAGVSPHDPYIGRKLIKEMQRQDPVAANQVLSHLVGGLLYGERGLTNRRTGEDFAGKAGGLVAHSLPGRAGGAAIHGVTAPIFGLNRWLERQGQYAALGKYARQQMQDLTGSWAKAMRAQQGALEQAAKGLKDTGQQQAAARYLDETLGQYSRFSPDMRRLIQAYTPFLPWYLNSARFVLWTLPAHHPVLTAALTQAEAAFQKDWEDQHKDIPPNSSLKTAIPSKGGFVDAARYTPFGLPGPLASGDLGSLSGIILPQTQGLQLAALGKDAFGQDLKVPGNKLSAGNVLTYGLNQAAESFVPGVGLARRIREGGGKPYATSTLISPKVQPVKPGGHRYSAADKILNPFRPVYVSQSRASKSTGGPLPAGVSQAELDALKRQAQAQQGKLPPGVSQAELDALKRQAVGR